MPLIPRVDVQFVVDGNPIVSTFCKQSPTLLKVRFASMHGVEEVMFNGDRVHSPQPLAVQLR